ncbi:hypothetical protein PVAP13_7NG196151 [Panicum virgatum]|uniref:Uncharacterized protein n=1 Tax=Panicum virgatum TaxID=38727 RepID=A0A8T0PZ37_PANVG|nr:hypothetical protein PVAP13_7NG196151 [Panicum virgatum]
MASNSGDDSTSSGTTTIIAARSYHMVRIDGYSRSLNTEGNRPSFNSDPFRAGGRTWHVIYRPMGSPCCPENTEHISLFLALDDDLADGEVVMAKGSFSLLDRDRKPVHTYTAATVTNNFTVSRVTGAERFVRRQDLERSEYLKGDCFAVRVHVCIFKGAPPVAVPPLDIHRHLGGLLSGKEGTDVEFRVRGETFAAHRFVLAARSPVFRAELFGPMKEGTTADVVRVDDMEAQRLKLMCEDKLRQHMDASSVASILALAEQHRCPRLKEACFKFLGFSSVAFLEAIASEEFECPQQS